MTVKKPSASMFNGSQISAFRLTRHHFLDQHQTALTTVCQDVCGTQAQVMAAARMALWARMHELTGAEIHSALWEKRTLVRTSCMRQTLHLIPASDFSIYIPALRRSRGEALFRIMSKFGITRREADAMNEAVVEALRGGPMTLRDLTEHIKPKAGKRVRKWMARFWSVVRPAIVEGLVCYGPDRGQEATFVRVDQWLPGQREVSEEEAKQVLLRRYLGAFGPATLRDFSKWAGMPIREATAVWESLDEELVEISVEKNKGSVLRNDFRQLRNSELRAPVLRLLPSFDPYVLGHVEKDHLVDDRHYKRVYRDQWWISPVVLLNGRIIGTWSYPRRGKRMSLEVRLFEKGSKMIRARIEEEAASLGRFLETSWEVKFNK